MAKVTIGGGVNVESTSNAGLLLPFIGDLSNTSADPRNAVAGVAMVSHGHQFTNYLTQTSSAKNDRKPPFKHHSPFCLFMTE